jgi:hypothetical protein
MLNEHGLHHLILNMWKRLIVHIRNAETEASNSVSKICLRLPSEQAELELRPRAPHPASSWSPASISPFNAQKHAGEKTQYVP